MIRAPLAPSGCPMAIAPPLTLVLARSAPVSAGQASLGLTVRRVPTIEHPDETVRRQITSAGCLWSNGAGAAAVYAEFGSSQVAGVVGCQEGDEVSDLGGVAGSAEGDATDGFDDLCACGIHADL
jgi:hypothetical protein